MKETKIEYKKNTDKVVKLEVSEDELIFIVDSIDNFEKTLIVNDNYDDRTQAFVELFRYRLDKASRKILWGKKHER